MDELIARLEAATERPKCHYCNDTGYIAGRSRDGQYAFPGPVPDDAKGYFTADCFYCDSTALRARYRTAPQEK